MSKIDISKFRADYKRFQVLQYSKADKLNKFIDNLESFTNGYILSAQLDVFFDGQFNLKTVSRGGLKTWAKILDFDYIANPNLTLEDARKVALMRYWGLVMRPTIPNINAMFNLVFGKGVLYATDSLNMNYVSVVFVDKIDYGILNLLRTYKLVPRPAGVGERYEVLPEPAFGFGVHHENFGKAGFGKRIVIEG